MGWVFAIVMTLLFMGTVLLVSAVMAMEERMMSDPEELREICEACMWREVGDKEAWGIRERRIAMDTYAEQVDIAKEYIAKAGINFSPFQLANLFSGLDFERYENKLRELSELIEQAYLDGFSPQWNILTDRMMLHEMNNCGAGDSTITLAPNGKFYICPAFYYEDMGDSVGDVNKGLDIPNQYLYKLENAPICRHCDAYQCKRCIWLNRKMTLEVNTPSHEQCVAAHLERNASRQLQKNIRKYGEFLPEIDEIKEIDYLDPFNNKEKWQQENL